MKTPKYLDAAEPSMAELAAIDAEWPLIEAELAVVDAEIAMLHTHGGPSALDWRRLRRAEARVTRVAAELAATSAVSKPIAKPGARVDAVSAADLASVTAEWPWLAPELDMRAAGRKAA